MIRGAGVDDIRRLAAPTWESLRTCHAEDAFGSEGMSTDWREAGKESCESNEATVRLRGRRAAGVSEFRRACMPDCMRPSTSDRSRPSLFV
mmetsp:Transcript_126267/g.178190  ORF Transcript_126267/g.178190 Transcript_126267/m.178190 type:complete len:91 (+) Transcript_126267:208-480(+)